MAKAPALREGERRATARLAGVAAVAAGLVLVAAFARPAQPDTALVSRVVPPPTGSSYFGFTYLLFDSADPVWGDSRPFTERVQDAIQYELAGKTPTFLTVWTPWQHPDAPGEPMAPFSEALPDIAKVREVIGDGGLIYLDWNLGQSTATLAGITTHDIATGKLDGYIRRYARDVRAYGKPLLVRLFNGEFNGSWWVGISPWADPRVTTGDFVNAWRRVVDIFRAVGANNVSWAWTPNAYPSDGPLANIDRNIGAYWPGDDYVDWAGADFYDVGSPNWLDGPYSFAVAHHKPFIVAEFGIRHEWSSVPPSQWGAWIASAFDYFESHPAIAAITYFNLNNRRAATHVPWDPTRDVFTYGGKVSYTPNLNDHDSRLIAGGAAIRALYAQRISSSRYVSTVASQAVDATPQPASFALLATVVRSGRAVMRWQANLAADSFDVAVARDGGQSRVLVAHLARSSYPLWGKPGERLRVRIRVRDVFDAVSAWSAPMTVRFPRR